VVLNEGTKKAIVAATVDATLVAPASIHWEFGNALSALLKRKRISKQEAWDCLEEYGKIPVQFVDVDMIEAISIAEKHHIYAYDAYMVAAAKQYRIPLLSLDSGLREIAKKEKVRLLEA
jgi:predicted nucleic acid-binding protein